ncbi:helix-turn-helix domain-containing protein [Chengkuizengella axinellae]|uniref:MerR family transcriptional regulator n=1 Tax=Chengkuizengella axinellae TaxID=3064388 RepID=A0ABT9J4I4_9BACL|nr:MerR family transcriptional regulator [Chengkuizengella sp. 2205SS18-9]MDP5275849.1 MerR family transcriptional regulator [Chengkuizengella sp. 2205SS18-9]
MSMTINVFSTRTGLPPSTLRYYDRKNLLSPSERLNNGYRVYTEEQISAALMIHSLRQADVSIQDISDFLDANEQVKQQLIHKWRSEVEAKLSSITIAKQYLGGMTAQENHIHLTKWENERTFLWFKHTVPRKIHPFQHLMKRDAQLAKKWGYKIHPEIYVRTLDAKSKHMKGEIGFLLENENNNHNTAQHEEVYIEKIKPSLFAIWECSAHNEFLCFNYMQLLQKYGFLPIGLKLERFNSADHHFFQLMIPLMQK